MLQILQVLNNVSNVGQLSHSHHVFNNNKKKNNMRITVTLNNNNSSKDPLTEAAIHAATLRFQETLHPEPLFHDPYVACLIPANTSIHDSRHTSPYCVATRFIDDKLLQILRNTDELKQVILLTDGADTRAYRLTWPRSTLIFNLSPAGLYNEMSQKLRDIGAQITSSCLLVHIPLESPNIEGVLRNKGFNGNRPSIWVLQGLPLTTVKSFEDVLTTVGSLAMKGSLLIGEIYVSFSETELQLTKEEWTHKLFVRHGFQVQLIDYQKVASYLGRELPTEFFSSILFVAEHLRFSDDQMETWRREFQRAEDEGDEESFEDL